MNLYVTFGDQPSGIFRSQVIDFVRFHNQNNLGEIRLVAFISARGFKSNRDKIKSVLPTALVIPMYPRLVNWRINRFVLNFLCRRIKPSLIYGRGVLATLLAIEAKKKDLTGKVIYDGRGAISAEWHEYNVVNNDELKARIWSMEKDAVMRSDYRIAVSSKLVDYWKQEFNYKPGREAVVPCTLDESYERININEKHILEIRQREGLPTESTILVFSGSMAGWQSVGLLGQLLENLFKQPQISILFLSQESAIIKELKEKFPGRVKSKFVSPEAVPQLLEACDYGLLIREPSVTNKVASPVKFAEYLACGLKVIISDNIGDYSRTVVTEGLGYLATELPEVLSPMSLQERKLNNAFAITRYSKTNFRAVYESLNKLN